MKKILVSLMIATLFIPLVGCDWMTLFAVAVEQKKKVPAEYNKLADHSALVYIWVEPETRFDYQFLQLELTSYVTEYLKSKVENVDLTSPQLIIDYVEQKLDMELDPEKIGNHFGVDQVVYIEIMQFQLRDPTAPDLVQAKIDSSVSVYDLSENPDNPEVFDLAPVRVTFPEGSPQMISSVNIDRIRRNAYLVFAEEVSKKFYEYEEILN